MQEENTVKKQREFIHGKIKVSSKFESGNISDAIISQDNQINLWIGADPSGNYKTWFYFSVEGITVGSNITFIIMNMSNQVLLTNKQVKLFKEGHQPVYRTQSGSWKRIKIPMAANAVTKVEAGYQVTFKHLFAQNCVHYFAFSFPWTNKENNCFIETLRKQSGKDVFSSYETLCSTYQHRSVMLLTLTQPQKGEQPEEIKISENSKILSFTGKRGIFISARVHPGEIAASHMMNGILKFLFSNTDNSNILLQNFVFYIVPIINPDGVAQGNFRTDTQGKNLNRYYTNPSLQNQPEIYGIKDFLVKMIKMKKIDFCLDLHAHVNKQGAFIYGNSVAGDLKGQMNVCLFPKILSFHNEIFDFDSCNFSEKNMSSKDKSDQLSKQGASRVAIFKETGLTRCWTLQCNYNSSKITHILPKPCLENNNNSVSHTVITGKVTPQQKQQLKLLNIEDFQKIGIDICQSIIDFYQIKHYSPIFNTKLKNMNNIKLNTAITSLRLIPFRFDGECRKIMNNINSGVQIRQNLIKIAKIININFQTKKEIDEVKKQNRSWENVKNGMVARKKDESGSNRVNSNSSVCKTNNNSSTSQNKIESLNKREEKDKNKCEKKFSLNHKIPPPPTYIQKASYLPPSLKKLPSKK